MNRCIGMLPLTGLFVAPLSMLASSAPEPRQSDSLAPRFQKKKQQFRYVSYGDALPTLDELALISPEESGHDTKRTPLEP